MTSKNGAKPVNKKKDSLHHLIKKSLSYKGSEVAVSLSKLI